MEIRARWVWRICPTFRGLLPFSHVELQGKKPVPRAYPRELRTIGDHVRKRRLDMGLLQKEAARIIGVATNTLIIWEKNHRPVAVKLMPKIVAFLAYDPLQHAQ
jgi:DNA-binding XRE family transcriptional regulator